MSSTVMDFVAVVFMLALLCFFSFDATVFSVNKNLYMNEDQAEKSKTCTVCFVRG